ncbi:MAG: hypothetical protein IPJ20_14080 [Flammeovirgaceae bacterium]|nr:hypothetical protein [Flammeovirgaceae bacterium]
MHSIKLHSTTKEPVPLVKPAVEPDVLLSIDPKVLEDAHVYVHCYFKNEINEMLIRVWRTTYLIDSASGCGVNLFTQKIFRMLRSGRLFPQENAFLLLIFTALPKRLYRV